MSFFLFYTILFLILLFLLPTISNFIKVLDKLHQERLESRTFQQLHKTHNHRPDKFFSHITIIIILINKIITIIIVTINIIIIIIIIINNNNNII